MEIMRGNNNNLSGVNSLSSLNINNVNNLNVTLNGNGSLTSALADFNEVNITIHIYFNVEVHGKKKFRSKN